MFSPNQSPVQFEGYPKQAPGSPVKFIQGEKLPKSTRSASSVLEFEFGGTARFFVLRHVGKGREHEYQVLRAMSPLPLLTAEV